MCKSIDGFKSVNRNKYSILPCPNNEQGLMMRLCNNDGIWEDIKYRCGSSSASFTMNDITIYSFEFFRSEPIYSLRFDYFNLKKCNLPKGVYFDRMSGAIYGTPNTIEESSEVCIIQGIVTEVATPVSNTFKFQITNKICPSNNTGYPDTVISKYATKPCPLGYSGNSTRYCNDTNPPTWGVEDFFNCVPISPNLTISITGYSFAVLTEINPIVLNVDHPTPSNVSCSSSPSLPDGFSITQSHTIIGKTETVLPSTLYTITCKFQSLSSSVSFHMAIRSGNLTSIKYIDTSMIFPLRIYKSYDPPTIFGSYVSFSLYPQLPIGVNIDPVDGHIFGTALAGNSVGPKTITVGAYSPDQGTVTTEIKINIVDYTCPKENGFGQTSAGLSGLKSCGAYQSGTISRECLPTDPPVWSEEIVNSCHQLYPVNLTYESTVLVFSIGFYSEYHPILVGDPIFTTYTLHDELPKGLTFNNGIISGEPTEEKTVNVSISAVQDINITIIITIFASLPRCQEETADNYTFNRTGLGELASYPCSDKMKGNVYRRCGATAPPTWGVIDISQCRYDIPSSITYDSLIFYVNYYASFLPSYDQKPSKYTIVDGALPYGVTLNELTGELSGTPLLVGTFRIVIVGENNSGKSDEIPFEINIHNAYCNPDGGFSTTIAGSFVSIDCQSSSQIGKLTRSCQITKVYPPEWSEITSTCVESPPEFEYKSGYQVYAGVAVVRIEPTNLKFNPTEWKISPPLPNGMYFTYSGAIIGTASFTEEYVQTYTISAKNDLSDTWRDKRVDFVFRIAYCTRDNQWKRTPLDGIAGSVCPSYEVGNVTRRCFNVRLIEDGYEGVWDNPNYGNCISYNNVAKGIEGLNTYGINITFSNIDFNLISAQSSIILKEAFIMAVQTNTQNSIKSHNNILQTESANLHIDNISISFVQEISPVTGNKLLCLYIIRTYPTNDKISLLDILNTQQSTITRNYYDNIILLDELNSPFEGIYPLMTNAYYIEYVPPKQILSTGAIIGISIGGLIVVCLVIYGIIHLTTKPKKRRHDNLGGNQSLRLANAVGGDNTPQFGGSGTYRASVRRGLSARPKN